MGEDGGQVAHRAAGDEERGFFARAGRGDFLQTVDGGVFAVHIVADFGFGHGLAHGGRGMGDGIGAEIYEVHGVILCEWGMESGGWRVLRGGCCVEGVAWRVEGGAWYVLRETRTCLPVYTVALLEMGGV